MEEEKGAQKGKKGEKWWNGEKRTKRYVPGTTETVLACRTKPTITTTKKKNGKNQEHKGKNPTPPLAKDPK